MKVYNSPVWVGIALIVIIVIICLTFTLRVTWWSYIDVFFFFMAAFCQLIAVTLGVKIPQVGAKLSMIAFLCAVLGIIALIGEAIAWNIAA